MPVAWAHGNTGAADRSNVVGGTSAGIQPADSETQTEAEAETKADDEFSHTRVYRARPYAVYSTIMAVLGNNRYFSVESFDIGRMTVRCRAHASGILYDVSVFDRGLKGSAVTVLPAAASDGTVPLADDSLGDIGASSGDRVFGDANASSDADVSSDAKAADGTVYDAVSVHPERGARSGVDVHSDVEALFAGFLAVLRAGDVIEGSRPTQAAKMESAGINPPGVESDHGEPYPATSTSVRAQAAPAETTRMESAGVETTRAEPMHINPARIVQAEARPARIDAEQGNSGRVVISGRHPGSQAVTRPMQEGGSGVRGRRIGSHPITAMADIEQSADQSYLPVTTGSTAIMPQGSLMPVPPPPTQLGKSARADVTVADMASVAQDAGASHYADGTSVANGAAQMVKSVAGKAARGFRLALRWMCLRWNVRRGARPRADDTNGKPREEHNGAVSSR
ncbi:hypothetical protein [Pseudoscardovia suis]|uniref:Uncharacterized protein n=1 Tax=Pseudoscardovia suis TaxID=987063 RepID=A0A261F1K1_9BIFI|nr:hypothetical protein [Pseudoscardovia suis]OZG52999.1 hypothetical protein PSSU_0617 [Pseudoscardovia suis]PJJ68505.1 hypothetical protein CLV65_1083 [Pseudoscardovia suis]